MLAELLFCPQDRRGAGIHGEAGYIYVRKQLYRKTSAGQRCQDLPGSFENLSC